MARYPVNPYPSPLVPKALSYLRSRSGLTRNALAQACSQAGNSVSASYLAQLEADRTPGSKSFRVPSVEKLQAVLAGLGMNLNEFEEILRSRPWENTVSEGNEWDNLPASAQQTNELLELFEQAMPSARIEILAAARRLT